jgi:hypothetical protein
MKRHSHVLGMLFAAVVVVTVSQPAHAYLYKGHHLNKEHHLDSEFQPKPGDGVANRLEWKIEESDLTHHDTITSPGATVDLARCLEDPPDSHAASIPSAVWLIGSGILGLIGLQRRRGRKA